MKKRGGQLLEEMGSAQRALKAAEFAHKAELDASTRKSQFFQRKAEELEAKLLEEQKEVQRLKAQQGAQLSRHKRQCPPLMTTRPLRPRWPGCLRRLIFL